PGEEGYVPHTSATLYYRGSDVLKVFTSNWWGVTADGERWALDQEQTYTRFGYFAARHHGGDMAAAASAAAQLRAAAGEDPVEGWLADIAAQSPQKAAEPPERPPLDIRWVPDLEHDMPPE